MPIFAYLIIQGFFYTKDLKKYILRMFILATFTQICLMILGYINEVYYPKYWTSINNYLGIVYSYTLSLLLLAVIDRKVIIKKLTENQNIIVRINIFILILVAYLKFKIEFDLRIPFLFLELYAIEKLFMKDGILIKKSKNVKLIEKVSYIILILVAFAISLLFITYSSGCIYAMLGAIIFIILYNGERGQTNKLVQYIFYLIFPIQHIFLYLLAMIIK